MFLRNAVVAAKTVAVQSYKRKLITTVRKVYMNLFSEFLLQTGDQFKALTLAEVGISLIVLTPADVLRNGYLLKRSSVDIPSAISRRVHAKVSSCGLSPDSHWDATFCIAQAVP